VIAEGLLKMGYSDTDVQGIMGHNNLRVAAEVLAIAPAEIALLIIALDSCNAPHPHSQERQREHTARTSDSVD
jgi:hypothetical protein